MNYSRCDGREPRLGGGFLIPRTACPTLKQSQLSRSKAFPEFLNFKQVFPPSRDTSGHWHSVAVLSHNSAETIFSLTFGGTTMSHSHCKRNKAITFFPIRFALMRKSWLLDSKQRKNNDPYLKTNQL